MDELTRQAIERFELAVDFAKEFEAELGRARAHEIIGRAFEKRQVRVARELAEKLGSNTMEALAAHSRKQASERDSLEVLEVTDKSVALRITRCQSWEAFKHLGAPELCRLYCDSDDAYIQAFSPAMRMVRTKTIAAGDEYCDHKWVMKDGE